MSRILLTGVTGLLGARLLECAGAEHEFVSLSRSAPPARCQWIPCDLASGVGTDSLPAVDTVMHLAQSRRFREFPTGAHDVFAVNVASTQLLLDWARRSGARRFILASSGGVYGRGFEPFAEHDPPAVVQPGHYLATKLAAEFLASAYRAHFTVIVLRPFFVYGPGQDPSMLVPRIVDSVRCGRPVTLQGQDGMLCNPVFVDDAAHALLRCTTLDTSDTINIAGPEVCSLRRIAETAAALLGIAPRLEVVPAAGPPHLLGSIEHMRRALIEPQTGVAEGIGHMVGNPAQAPS